MASTLLSSGLVPDSMLLQTGKNLTKMLLMFFGCGTGDEQVIQVGVAEGQAAKHLVDKALECLSCVA